MFSVTGIVSKIEAATEGYPEKTYLGQTITVEVQVPWVGLKWNSTSTYENKTSIQNQTFFVPNTETPPLIGDTVELTMNVLEVDEVEVPTVTDTE